MEQGFFKKGLILFHLSFLRKPQSSTFWFIVLTAAAARGRCPHFTAFPRKDPANPKAHSLDEKQAHRLVVNAAVSGIKCLYLPVCSFQLKSFSSSGSPFSWCLFSKHAQEAPRQDAGWDTLESKQCLVNSWGGGKAGIKNGLLHPKLAVGSSEVTLVMLAACECFPS